MPGMMETVLNVGLTEKTIPGLAKKFGSERFAYDAYRRLMTMYSDVVLNVHANMFEEALERKKEMKGVHNDTDLTAADLKSLPPARKTPAALRAAPRSCCI